MLAFNRCYNFPSIYTTFDSNIAAKFKNEGYYLEFWYKMDGFNVFCGAATPAGTREYIFYSIPHSFYLSADGSKLIYELTTDNSISGELTRFSLNEWNTIVIEVKKQNVNNISSQTLKIYSNNDLYNVDKSYSFDAKIDLGLYGIGFCNGICDINSSKKTITWNSAFYKNLRVWDSGVNPFVIQDYNNGM